MTEFRVDPRQTTAEERAEGVRQAQVLFKLNHTMPFTDEYYAYVQFAGECSPGRMLRYMHISSCWLDPKYAILKLSSCDVASGFGGKTE